MTLSINVTIAVNLLSSPKSNRIALMEVDFAISRSQISGVKSRKGFHTLAPLEWIGRLLVGSLGKVREFPDARVPDGYDRAGPWFPTAGLGSFVRSRLDAFSARKAFVLLKFDAFVLSWYVRFHQRIIHILVHERWWILVDETACRTTIKRDTVPAGSSWCWDVGARQRCIGTTRLSIRCNMLQN